MSRRQRAERPDGAVHKVRDGPVTNW